MASGSGKNQDDTETKEPVDLVLLLPREESNAAASTSSSASASASATEPPPLAQQFNIIEEDGHGPPEAGGREPSAATAAAAERKGEETMCLFRRGSAGSKPPLLPRPSSVRRARGPSSAGGKAPSPPRPMSRDEVLASGMGEESEQKPEAEGLPRQQNEQVKSPAVWPGKKSLLRKVKSPAIRPEKDKKPLWRTMINEDATGGVNTLDRRGRRISHKRIFLITIMILFGYLPTVIGFQRFDPDEAANELQRPEYHVQIQQVLAAHEAQEADRLRTLWWTAAIVLFLAFLFGNIMGGANNGHEDPILHEALVAEIGRGHDLLIVVLILFALVVVTVALRVALRGQL